MATISINDVTTTVPTGDGVFDVLMRSIDSHLDKQYTSGRIKGADYATVYLGAIQTVLQQSIAFVLSEQKAEKEVDILSKELLLRDAQLTLSASQNAEVLAGTIRQNELKAEQIDASSRGTVVKETLATKQGAIYDAQALGFVKDYKFKVFKSLLDLRSTGLTQGVEGMTDPAGNALVKDMLTDVGLTFNAEAPVDGTSGAGAAGFLAGVL